MLRPRFDCLLILAVAFDATRGKILNRPLYVYEGLIESVHDYFNNTCIILFHATEDPLGTQGLQEGDTLLALQRYLSGSLHVRTSIMDFAMFRKRVGQSYYHIKRPLFVLLNDQAEVREEFAGVSSWIAMAYPTWLIFLDSTTVLEDFFQDAYLPFDCKLMVARNNSEGERITEVYRVDRGEEIRAMEFGSWSPSTGLRSPRLSLYQRRNNLFGRNIRVVTVHDPPMSALDRDQNNEVIGMRGFFGEVLKLIQEGINCTISYTEAETWGVCLKNGSWTGALGMLINNEVDLAATELLMTSDRLGAIEFTTPIYATKSRTYIKKPDSTSVKWNAYTAPFAVSIWNSILLLMLVTSGTIAIIRASFKVARTLLEDHENSPSNFLEIFFHVFGAFCSQGMAQSSLDPVRMVQLVVHLTGVIVLAGYSAALISFLAVKTFVMPFTTMEGLLEDGTYRFAVVAESADYSFFQNTSDKVLSVMFEQLLARETDLPFNYLDGLKRLCEEKKYAFMMLDNMAMVLQQNVDCTLEPLDVIMQATIAMAVPNKSPYRGIIDSNILLLRDSGILQRLLKSQPSIEKNRAKSSWTSVEIGDVIPLLVFLSLALFLSCLIFSLERLAHRKAAP